MNVLFVSQCSKRALTETRRILDQFAERCGERTWQTPITQAGLETVHKLLRQSARKNTAVACRWIHGQGHSELLWVVGDARQFNAEGAVPTNATVRDILRADDENGWHSAEAIRRMAQLAALLHDLGKASQAFQQRLKGERNERNLIRHEWVSLRLFLAFVGEDGDRQWLERLSDETAADEACWTDPARYLFDKPGSGPGSATPPPFASLLQQAPLAAVIGWLVVTHHRLPAAPPAPSATNRRWGDKHGCFEKNWLTDPLAAIACEWNEVISNPQTPPKDFDPYWRMADPLPVAAHAWRKQAARVARHLLKLQQPQPFDWLNNIWALHLARLCLMLADHHYSSLGMDGEGRPVAARQPFVQSQQKLFANTVFDRTGRRQPCQSLLEHLLGVSDSAAQISHALPGFERHLPRLARHRGLRQRSSEEKFRWQDKAFDAAEALREAAREQGAFIINMASTGCGKTLANARVLYALADPQRGLRASFALGLRTLTMQTGRSYQRDLHLREDELAVLAGGAANRALFEFHQQQAQASGSESAQDLLEEGSHVLYEGEVSKHPLLARALADGHMRKLLSAPLLVCTIDHLMPASESMRAGRQIAPLLRLMSADLVLDELDDYDMDDLPALARLVFFAGMAGARVLLSSATLPPALVQGMFSAYQAGRRQHRLNRGQALPAETPVEVPCLWVDEFGKPQTAHCHDAGSLAAAHARFVERRIEKLQQERQPLRIARLHKLEMPQTANKQQIRRQFAQQVWQAASELHQAHAQTDPVSKKARASFGIVRMANIEPLIEVAQALIATPPKEGMRLHLCVYHARFPLAQRSAIEATLDAAFDRRNAAAIWQQPSVRQAIDAAPDCEHVFMALASPVCEVGRDWDADWAVAEPSSMRSIIQLAGRVQRHRRQPSAQPNLLVFDTNLKALEQPGEAAFLRPGFEKDSKNDSHGRFRLASHRLTTLRPDSVPNQAAGERIDAVPRIRAFVDAMQHAKENWVALEHARLENVMHFEAPQAIKRTATGRSSGPGWQPPERDCASLVWQFPQTTLLGVLPQQQPFREDNRPDRLLAFLPDEDETQLVLHRYEPDLQKLGREPYIAAREMVRSFAVKPASGVSPWSRMDLPQLLECVRELAEAEKLPLRQAAAKFTAVQVPREGQEGQGWYWDSWLGFSLVRK